MTSRTATDERRADVSGSRRHEATISLALAVVAASLAILIFAPRFVYWHGVSERPGSPGAGLVISTETYRAFDSLRQLRDPWALVVDPVTQVDDLVNRVIVWRLLFPLAWHYLNLPAWLYLAMPHMGCVLALWIVAWLTYQRLRDWPQTWMTTALFATLPWFFVSTGWLTYFDSWIVLASVVVAFVPSRWALGSACLLTPWIDERFVVALPVAVAVRAIGCRRIDDRRAMLLDVAVVLAASLPYPMVRAVVWLHGDPDATAYVQGHWDGFRRVPVLRYLEGLWSGFRAAWVMIGAAIWFGSRRVGWKRGALLGLLVLGSAVAALFIAADMSHTLMIVSPVVLLGIWSWREASTVSFRYVLPAVLAANLLLPAEHVLWALKIPIRTLYAEIDDYRHPSGSLRPGTLAPMSNMIPSRGPSNRGPLVLPHRDPLGSPMRIHVRGPRGATAR